MASNSTEVTYGFGQMGSILVDDQSTITISDQYSLGIPDNVVFVAITFLQDTTFNTDNATGLVAENAFLFPNSNSGALHIDTNGSATNGITFPRGITIYGRWTGFKLASGVVVAYIGY
tara:strand:- start:1458 stop:1811 length:354 start_codon:yes stop_codon:yes gene_type:complete